MPRKKKPQSEIASNSSTSTDVMGESPGASALKDAQALPKPDNGSLETHDRGWICIEFAGVLNRDRSGEPVSEGSRKYRERIRTLHDALGEHECIK